jgi:probable F420-dependent oxidoreductase
MEVRRMLSKPKVGPLDMGLYALNSSPTSQPEALTRVAPLVEELGYDSVWVGDHAVLPDPPVPQAPFDPRMVLADPIVVLSFLAAVTSRVRLCTGLMILPLRNPVVLAKQLSSVDVLSNGRLTFGFGMGYIEAEAAAVGIPFAERSAMSAEFLAAMRSLWYDDRPAYHGRYVEFGAVNAFPRPRQKDIPLVTGGHTPTAYRRAVTQAHGWYGFMVRPEDMASHIAGLSHAADTYARPARLGPLEITVTPRGQLTTTRIEHFRRSGVDRLVMNPWAGLDLAGLEAYLRQHARLITEA